METLWDEYDEYDEYDDDDDDDEGPFQEYNGSPNRPSRNMTRYGERLSGLRRSSHFSEMSDAKAVNCTFPSQGDMYR